MAFGKNPEHLDGVVPFGGSVAQRAANAARRPKRTSGGGGAYWIDQYRPSEHSIDTVHLIPGNYTVQRATEHGDLYEELVNWFEYTEHYHASFQRGAICSAGPLRGFKNKRGPCYGCDIFWEDYEIRKQIAIEKGLKRVENPRRVSMMDNFVFSVLDMGVFHKMAQTDENGQIKINPSTKEPYWNWQKCKGAGCEGCMRATESKQGHVQPWPMGRDHFTALNGYGDYIGASCATCSGRNTIDWLLWQCGNPNCGYPVIRKNATTMSPQQIYEMTSQVFVCHQCNVPSYLQEIVQCVTCTPQQRMPTRATIYDVDLQVTRKKAPDSNKSQLIVVATSDPKSIDAQYAEMAKPIDLPKRYAPTPLEKQAVYFKYSPNVQDDAGQHAQPYGQQQ